MYKKILVPLDGSSASESILSHVEGLARACGATLCFLEVLEALPPHATVVVPEMLAEGASQRAGEIQHYVQELAETFRSRGLAAEAFVRRGNVAETILQVASELGADLIAMSSHDYRGLARIVHGSVAGDVLHRATVPLLIVRIETTN